MSVVACSSDDSGGTQKAGSSGTGGSSGGGSGGSSGGGSGGSSGGGSGGSSGGGSGGSSGGGTPSVCNVDNKADFAKFDYSKWTPDNAKQYTFASDVFPILKEAGCGLAVCHSATKLPNLQKADAALTTLKASSQEASGVQIVKPGDPEKSFLMAKLDGSQNCEGFSCNKYPGQTEQVGCGTFMPQSSSTPIDMDKRNIVRTWIKQGAN